MCHLCVVWLPKGANSLCMQAPEVAASCGDKRWPQIYAASHTTAFFPGWFDIEGAVCNIPSDYFCCSAQFLTQNITFLKMLCSQTARYISVN